MGARDISVDAELLRLEVGRIDRIWAEHCAPPPQLTVTQWAEANRVLSAKDSAEPGPYRVRRTPYAQEPQDCLGARSTVEEVVLMWGAQTSKTTVGTNWIGYTIEHNPGPMMVMWPTINVAKRNSRQRLTPMFDATPSLRRKISERKAKDEANTMLLKDFAGGVLAIVGANSGSDLSSMPMRDIFMDEVDRFPVDIPGEGRPAELAEARQTTYPRRKRLKTSTPTVKEFSDIEAAFEASDQCYYHVPCPHCGEMQPLEWGADKPHGLKWDKDEKGRVVRSSMCYVCKHSGCEIKEHFKTQMLAAGKWVAHAPGVGEGKVRGFHLSSLYSPLGWLSWFDIAKQWVAAMEAKRKGDLSKIRVFINTRLAETYEDQGDAADEHEIKKRAAEIPLRVVQDGHCVLTLAVDVQRDRLHLGLWAWGRDMRRQLVDRMVIDGDTSIAEEDASVPEEKWVSPWTHLTKYRRTDVVHTSGRIVPLLCTMVDSSDQTQAVYGYARAHASERVMAVKGLSISGRAVIGKPTMQEVNYRGEKIQRGVKMWPIGTDTAKVEIYGRMRVSQPGAGYVLLSKAMPDDAFEQLTSERLITKYDKGGRPKREWVLQPGRRNEDLDCAVYALAGAHWAGIDRWRASEWAKWERRVEKLEPSSESAQPAAKPGTKPAAASTPAQDEEPAEKVAQVPKRKKARRGTIGGGSTGWGRT